MLFCIVILKAIQNNNLNKNNNFESWFNMIMNNDSLTITILNYDYIIKS